MSLRRTINPLCISHISLWMVYCICISCRRLLVQFDYMFAYNIILTIGVGFPRYLEHRVICYDGILEVRYQSVGISLAVVRPSNFL